jgi:hypothetical protein
VKSEAQHKHELEVELGKLRGELNREPRQKLIQMYIALVDECVKWQSIANYYKQGLEKLGQTQETKEVTNETI